MASVGVTGHVVAAAYLALLTGWLIGRLGGSIRLGGARRFVVDAAAAAEEEDAEPAEGSWDVAGVNGGGLEAAATGGAAEGLVDEEKADEVDVLEEPG